MGKIISQCPSCESDHLKVVKIECGSCKTRFEGLFDIPALVRLSEDHQRFVLDFVRTSGSLKDMAKLYEVSYPTMRNRLNELIKELEHLQSSRTETRQQILEDLEAGRITAVEAAHKLKHN